MNLVVGSINYDFTIYVSDFPEIGQTITDGVLRESPGGKGFNQAVASARAGAKTKFIGCVGDDSISNLLMKHMHSELKENKKFIPQIIKIKNVKSGCAFITVRDNDGSNKIVVSPGANRKIPKSKVYEQLKKKDFSCILLQCELDEDIVRMCLEFSRKNGKKIFLNAAPFKPWVKDVFHLANFLIANEIEILHIGRALGLNGEILQIVKEISKGFPGGIVVTLGKRGLIFCDRSRCFHMGAFQVRSVDTVGAGDSFCGYFSACIELGKSLEDALLFASASGALSTTKKGAFKSIPYFKEVERFIRNSKKPEIKTL